ncbi:translation initiation factor IF-2 N-terminal domain-containing protein, partial [Campylobacter ureolyticus]
MAEVRISEIALELGYTSKEIIEKANEMGLKKIKAQNSAVSMEEAEAIYNYVQTGELPQKLKTKSKIHSKPKKEIEILDDEEPIKKSKKEKNNKPKAEKTVKPKKESISKKIEEQKEEDFSSIKTPEEIKNEEAKKGIKETTLKKDIKTEIKEELKSQDKDDIKITKSKNLETPKKE